jgi:hypothetical protein
MLLARRTYWLVVSTIVGVSVVIGASMGQSSAPAEPKQRPDRALKVVTFNTHAYGVPAGKIDKRSIQITAQEDMHIVALEHFIGVQKGKSSDNGHILSIREDNPWARWEEAGTGMEPTGTTGYFGYCGRDYYTEVGGIGDIMAYETFPAGTHILVPRGQTLDMHCYAHNFSGDHPGAFHHMVRILYW